MVVVVVVAIVVAVVAAVVLVVVLAFWGKINSDKGKTVCLCLGYAYIT